MPKTQRKQKNKPRSGCPIATSLDLFGDRWTLVILRDLVMGKSKFGDFLESPEGIPTNILTDRLNRLASFGLATRHAYQDNPPRYSYSLTMKGAELLPVMQAICRWANKHMPATWKTPDKFLELSPPALVKDR